MQSLLCGIIYDYIGNIRYCGPFTISCGSIIAESNIEVVERVMTITQSMLQQQIIRSSFRKSHLFSMIH